MSYAAGVFSALLSLVSEVSSYYCDGGHYCATAKECCEGGCCYTYPLQRPSPPAQPPYRSINIFVYNHWYFWSVVCALSALAGCAYWAWRRRSRLCGSWCRAAPRSGASDHDSAGSIYLPPHYSRCNSFHRAPPPYNEVTSKPDLYPLVITYGDSGDKNCGNYLMVHYFRNYIIRPPRSMSATSTAESMNSSFMCNATNEANSMVPPPYSAENLDEWRNDDGSRREAVGENTRPAGIGIPRSFSTMTYMPTGGHKPASLCEDLPDSTATAQVLPNWSGLGNSPEPIDNNDFRASLIRTASRYAVELDLHKRYKYAAPAKELKPDSDSDNDGDMDVTPRTRWSPKSSPREHSPSELEILLSIERERSMREELRRERNRARGAYRNISPSRAESSSEVQSGEQPLSLEGTEMGNHRGRSGLYMPLNRFGRTTEGGSRRPSASAPTTPSGATFAPTLLSLSQRMSGSVFGSRASRMALEERNPLLENEEGDPVSDPDPIRVPIPIPRAEGPDDDNGFKM